MDVLTVVAEQPHTFLQPQPALYESALRLAKQYLDPVATQITTIQDERLQSYRKSRKRKRAAGKSRHGSDYDGEEDLLRMKQIFTQGLEIGQVWHQARRVLDAANDELDRSLPHDESDISSEDDQKLADSISVEEELEGEHESDLEKDGVDWEYDEDSVEGEEVVNAEEHDNLAEEEEYVDLEDETAPSDISMDDGGDIMVKDRHGLNDGFFSIDQFNKSTQFLEQQDARGDPDDGAASDEEDIDWTLDPLGQTSNPAALLINGTQRDANINRGGPNESEDEEDGPTFGNVNLDETDSDDDNDAIDDNLHEDVTGMGGDFSNTNDIQYADFFAPPARNVPKSKKQGKRTGRYQARDEPIRKSLVREDDANAEEDDEEDQEVQRAMAGVQRDLFDDEGSDADHASEDDADPSETLPSQRNLSSHERRQLALRAEIRRLEAENVAEKPWALSGETVAPTRPQNALLEEDLDFERAGKPLPIITAEVNESIEDLIKRRILGNEFDEVRRRRPDDLLNGSGKDARRGRLGELSDAKSKKSLAEEYEDDFLRKNDPNYVDTRSEALKAQHREIEQQWASVTAQLDSLSNWHYKPRPVAPSLDVRVDIPTVTLEDARPNAGGDVASASAVAPQELYSVGSDGKRGTEVVSKGGTVVARDEETRDQRKRRRQRQKERLRKKEGNKASAAPSADDNASSRSKRASKADVVGQLKRGGVKVISKKGELQDIEGNAVRTKSSQAGAGNYKL